MFLHIDGVNLNIPILWRRITISSDLCFPASSETSRPQGVCSTQKINLPSLWLQPIWTVMKMGIFRDENNSHVWVATTQSHLQNPIPSHIQTQPKPHHHHRWQEAAFLVSSFHCSLCCFFFSSAVGWHKGNMASKPQLPSCLHREKRSVELPKWWIWRQSQVPNPARSTLLIKAPVGRWFFRFRFPRMMIWRDSTTPVPTSKNHWPPTPYTQLASSKDSFNIMLFPNTTYKCLVFHNISYGI